MTEPVPVIEPVVLARSVPIIDMEIQRGGDGRTVLAYAAMFDAGYEVRDEHGHYEEVIARTAFDRHIGRGISHVQPLFNHGRNLYGEPSDRYSMPLGVPLELRPEARGLVTVTRYSKTPLGDEVLELIRDGALRAQSFRGPIFSSRRVGTNAAGLPIIERSHLGLRDYGPAPFAVNQQAEIIAVRSHDIAEQVGITPEQLAEVQRLLSETSPQPGPGDDVAPPDGPEPPEPPAPQPGDEPPATTEEFDTLAMRQAQRRRRHGSQRSPGGTR